MNQIKILPIDESNIEICHNINQKNVPEVGNVTLNEFQNLVVNSNLSMCVLKDDKPIAYVITFLDDDKTINFMKKVNHKNFIHLQNIVSNFIYIDRIAIDKNNRKMGIASELYKEIIKFAKQQNVDNLTAEINLLPTKNIASFKFHKKFQFTEIKTYKYSDDYEVSFQQLSLI